MQPILLRNVLKHTDGLFIFDGDGVGVRPLYVLNLYYRGRLGTCHYSWVCGEESDFVDMASVLNYCIFLFVYWVFRQG